MTMTLTEFLLARITEDEVATSGLVGTYDGFVGALKSDAVTRLALGHWFARFSPDRVLAECETKRQIMEDFEDYGSEYSKAPSDFAAGRRHAALLAVTRLAAIYADHPDYRQEWKP